MALPQNLAEWLAYQERLHPSAIELGLDRVRAVASRLRLLSSPPTTIIVGGTNGKGSTTTLLAASYRAEGYRVGAYTSPHLHRYNERVAIDGLAIDDDALCRAFAAIEHARAGQTLTYFEFGTLAALWLFREAGVEVQILEVGLGGRLDAVNILDADAAIVTNIGLDHLDWLGDNRDDIGREKAGIFRAGRIAVVADGHPPRGLIQAAEAASVQLHRFDLGDYRYERHDGGWVWQGEGVRSPLLPLPALIGEHQLGNAAGAVTVLQALQALQARLPVSWPAIELALSTLQLPGRMHRQGRFLFDVAHNAEAAEVLARTMREQFPDRPALWVAGILGDKPIEAIAAALAPTLSGAISCQLSGPRSLSDVALAARLAAAGIPTRAGGSPEQALTLALQQAGPDQPILVSGSFLTVAALHPLISP